MSLKLEERAELNPFDAPFYVICEEIFISGMLLKFGDAVPMHCDLNHLHHHYRNGVVGTLKEKESLDEPVELFHKDPIGPIALFVARPYEEKAPLPKREEIGEFSLENATLFKTKDDLIGYAAQFKIELKKATNISIKKMLEELEVKATEKGLIKA